VFFSAIVAHVLWILFAPLLLAISALRSIGRITLDPLSVIIRSSLALARVPAAHGLVRMITRRSEVLQAVWTAG